MEAIKLCRLDTPIIFIEARINLSRFVVTGCAAKTSATVTFPSLNLISLFAFCFNIWLNGVASYPSLVSWIKHSVDRFVIVSIFIPKLRLILILNSFLGSSDSLVFSELFHSLAPRPLAAKEWNNSLKTKLSLLPKKLFRIRMSRNFGMKMLTMTNLSTECLIQLTKLGYDATPFNQILKQ